jgi:hypothetical protein
VVVHRLFPLVRDHRAATFLAVEALPLFQEQAHSFFPLTQAAPIQSVRLQPQRLHSPHRDV